MAESSRFERLAALFESARGLESEAREAFLNGECGEDAELRKEVEKLLASHTGDGVLDGPVRMTDADAYSSDPVTIGRYRIIDCIGRGGMGAVYRAEQHQPRRTVAVKIMRAGIVGPESLSRFEFEASVLGRLQHPGIAQIYEAGTDDSGEGAQPFFAMEFVDGVRLDRHLEDTKSSIETRLRLFCDICDAVSHAHQKGVIHRDLKPANILVDKTGQPRILDFGVARATDADLQATLHTATGQVVGTLAYMSPEQIDTAPDRFDTRSDVYALGVVLYQMLAGRLPYDLSDRTLASAARVIEETDPAPLTQFHRMFRGDLNTIVLKALRKNPDERYQSASNFGDDVRRYLNNETIKARPATAVYQMRQFARRHRGLVGGVVTAMTILILGIVGVGWQAARVADEASTRRDVAAFLREMLTSLDPAKTAGEPITVRMMLDDAAARLENRFPDASHVRTDLHGTVGSTYQLLGEFELAEHHLRLAVDGFERERGISDDETLLAIATLALALRELDRLEEAHALLMATLDHVGDQDSPGVFTLRNNLAVVASALGRSDEAEAIYRDNYERAQERLGPDHQDTLQAQHNLGKVLFDKQRLDEAGPLIEGSVRGRRESLGDDHPRTLRSIANLAALRSVQGESEEAETLLREIVERSERVLGPRHLHTLRRRQNLIRSTMQRQDFAAATIQAREMLEVCERELGTAHAETLGAIELLVTTTAFGDSLEAAEALALEWHARLEAEHGPASRHTGRLALLLYNVYDSWGKADLKREWLDRVRDSAYQAPAHLLPQPDANYDSDNEKAEPTEISDGAAATQTAGAMS